MLLTHDTTRYVFYFGRLSEEKGVHVLVKAAQKLPEIQFVLAGNGPLEDSVDGENIQKVGFVSGRLLQTLIKNAEFVVSPSVCTETFGLSNGEAIKLGTPVIATNLGAFPETVVDGISGTLVSSNETPELSETISRLWDDKEYLERLKKSCKQIELTSIEDYTETYLQLL